MNSNLENIPEEILFWIGELDFHQLNTEQQDLVLSFMKASEYSEMHHVHVYLKQCANNTDFKSGAGKDKLMKQFDRKHKPVMNSLIGEKSFRFLKIAVLFCIALSSIMFLSNRINEKGSLNHIETGMDSGVQKRQQDTVYMKGQDSNEMGQMTSSIGREKWTWFYYFKKKMDLFLILKAENEIFSQIKAIIEE